MAPADSRRDFLPLAGAAYASDLDDVDVYDITDAPEARARAHARAHAHVREWMSGARAQVVIPSRSILLCNVLKNLAGPCARMSELEVRAAGVVGKSTMRACGAS